MKQFLAFSPDRGNREDCSVYYCEIVIADTLDEAQKLYSEAFGYPIEAIRNGDIEFLEFRPLQRAPNVLTS